MEFHYNIVDLAKRNTNFREILATANHSQIAVISIPISEETGMEVHKVDQIYIFVEGEAEATLNDRTFPIRTQDLVLVPAGTRHNFKNTGTKDLQLYTIYAPAQYPQNLVEEVKM